MNLIINKIKTYFYNFFLENLIIVVKRLFLKKSTGDDKMCLMFFETKKLMKLIKDKFFHEKLF